MYSTQKKRVAFNVSKMLAGAGAEGEVGDARALRGGRASVETEASLSSFLLAAKPVSATPEPQ